MSARREVIAILSYCVRDPVCNVGTAYRNLILLLLYLMLRPVLDLPNSATKNVVKYYAETRTNSMYS